MKVSMMGALAAVAAAMLAAGCAGRHAAGEKPRVALVPFRDARQSVVGRVEKKDVFGKGRTAADWTTDELAKRLTKAGFDVVVTKDEAQTGACAVVSGEIYRWDMLSQNTLAKFYGTAFARGYVTITRSGAKVLARPVTGDETVVLDSGFVPAFPLLAPEAGPMKAALSNMMDDLAPKVIKTLKERALAESEAT